jgi:predicted ribosomally synthesized peptide with SipW-like signal peptide
MKRSILISLMIIGAVAAMISGATFSAFTDSDDVTGTLTTGNVTVSVGNSDSFNFSPSCTDPIGSYDVCTSTVAVTYGGTNSLPASLALDLVFDNPESCFVVGLSWSGGGSDSGASPQQVLVASAASGTATVTVQVNNSLDQLTLNGCQDEIINLTLTATATELPPAP